MFWGASGLQFLSDFLELPDNEIAFRSRERCKESDLAGLFEDCG